MDLVRNRSFTLPTIYGKWTSLRRLKNSFPQGSILGPLFNMLISDLPTTVSRKYAHVNDLADIHADGDGQAVEEGVLSKDMATVGKYLQTWN